jgi:hypothetical protein
VFEVTGTSLHYFARGNTARGVHFLFDSAFQGLGRIFILEGGSAAEKSRVIRGIADSMIRQGRDIQCFHSPLHPDELNGLIVTGLGLGIVDGQECEGIPRVGTTQAVPIDFSVSIDAAKVTDEALRIIESLKHDLAEAYSKAYDTFAEALRIHDEWEQYYISSMDFAKADQVARELIQEFFCEDGRVRAASVRHLFFGAATPEGAIDHIQNLTADLKRRIFIKGRPGSGKSTMLKKIAAAAEQKGYDVEVFHCGFDPNSLDMLIFPELSTAIFDSTAPHEYFPSRQGDEILDMYERAMTPGTDEKYAGELAAIKTRYSAKMREATSYLMQARQIDDKIRSGYAEAVDKEAVRRLQWELLAAVEEGAGQSV